MIQTKRSPLSPADLPRGFRVLLVSAVLTIAVLLAPLLSSCAYREPDIAEVSPGDYPFFVDEGPVDGLLDAVDKHFDVVDRNQDMIASLTSNTISSSDLAQSLTTFRKLIEQYPDPVELNRFIRENFTVYRSAGRNKKQEMLVTGYYEPLFAGSLARTPPFIHPIYRVPDSLVRQSNQSIGRVDENEKFVPFWSRRDIESINILKGAELVYLQDKLDAYLLHIQGSGRIQLQDGSIRAVHFAASNGLSYNSLGKLFVDEGIMDRADVNIESIRRYFHDHPEQIDHMLQHNPRYIFFKWGDDKGARGSFGQVLTANRSIAIDHDALPTGAIAYLVSRRPVLDVTGKINHWRPFGRFVLPQDSGSAIKGPGRVDLFMGSDEYAAKAAGIMKEPGMLFFLLPKTASEKPL